MPNILRVTWPMPRPFSIFFFAGFWDIATMHLCSKFEVSSSTSFGDMLGGTPHFMRVTWPRPRLFSRFSLRVFEILPLCICVPNLKSLALIVLEICYGYALTTVLRTTVLHCDDNKRKRADRRFRNQSILRCLPCCKLSFAKITDTLTSCFWS